MFKYSGRYADCWGEVFKILVPLLFEYIAVIVVYGGCTPDEDECLNTQVGMQTAWGEVFKILVPLLFEYVTFRWMTCGF